MSITAKRPRLSPAARGWLDHFGITDLASLDAACAKSVGFWHGSRVACQPCRYDLLCVLLGDEAEAALRWLERKGGRE